MNLLNNVKELLTFDRLDESIKSFKRKGDSALKSKWRAKSRSGEGVEFYPMTSIGLSSFNIFYNQYLNNSFASERAKIFNYRSIAEMPEIADAIEDAVIEAAQEDFEGNLVHLKIIDPELEKNKQVTKILLDEFNNLFYNKIRIQDRIDELLRTYFIDGRVYYERIVDTRNQKHGLINIKKLPSETMEFKYNYKSGHVEKFYQFVNPDKAGNYSLETAIHRGDVIEFEPEQISFVDYGVYGATKNDIVGYLEKAKVPYNQLKLLETSLVIYRIVRAPERLVFKIDVGNMPKDKAKKYVESVRDSFTRKQTYDPSTGRLSQEPNVMAIAENFYLASGADGRGSDISSVGGASTAGFTELADIYYFQKKLYQALKYPMSRVTSMQDKRANEVLFSHSPAGEISRDEIKWATFLERQQNRFCSDFLNIFLLHLEFKGLKAEYKLGRDNLDIKMNPPSFYKDKQQQLVREMRFQNYIALAPNAEFSKSYLMKKYLEWDDEEIKANADGHAIDKKLKLVPEPQAQNY
jgi:hypothetical protein